MHFASQAGAAVRLEWGADAVEHLAGDVDCVVVVDVMSFSTCVHVAVARGAHVLPYARRDASAPAYARERGGAAALTDEALGEARRAVLADCASARELAQRGLAADIGLCLDEDASDVAARLDGDRFVAVARGATT